MNEIIQKINTTRETVKAYNDKNISASDWKQILETIKWAPTSFGFEQYRVVVIDRANTKLRNELLPAFFGQGVVTNASKLVIFVSLSGKVLMSDKWFIEREARALTHISGLKGKELETQVSNMHGFFQSFLKTFPQPVETAAMEWGRKQAYIALGMAMSAAAILNIGSTPMEGFDPAKVTEILRAHKLIRNDESAAVAVAFGYPKDKTAYAHRGNGKRVREADSVKFIEV